MLCRIRQLWQPRAASYSSALGNGTKAEVARSVFIADHLQVNGLESALYSVYVRQKERQSRWASGAWWGSVCESGSHQAVLMEGATHAAGLQQLGRFYLLDCQTYADDLRCHWKSC